MGDLHGVGHIAAGFLDAADVGVLGKTLHILHGDGAAGTARDVIEDAGDIHRVGHGDKVAVHTLGIGLVVVGSDEKQTVGPQLLRPEALLQHGLGAVGAGTGDHRDPARRRLDDAAQGGVVLLVGHGGALTGSTQGQDGVGLVLDMPLHQFPELVKIHAAVGVEGSDQGYDGALQIADVHVRSS